MLERIFAENTFEQISESLRTVLFRIFCLSLLLTTVKLIIAGTHYYDNEIFMSVIVFGLIVCTVSFILVFKKPKLLSQIIKSSLFGFTLYITVVLFFSEDRLNILTGQHILMIIMAAFYALNRFWGIIFSLVFFTILGFYFFQHGESLTHFTLFPPHLPYYISTMFVAINFVMITVSHYFYNKGLVDLVREKSALNDKLNRSLDAKSDFLATMSHELRTPLNSVIGMTNLLIHDNKDQSQQTNLNSLRFSAESLLILINDLLDFNKIDSHKVELEKIPFLISQLVEGVCAGLKTKAAERSLYLKVELEPSLESLYVLGDSARLTQIIYNLVGNAIKFTEFGGVSVKVGTIHSDSENMTLQFAISDTGIGIEAEKQQLIFEPFTQASSSVNRRFGGTGLGLTIVKHLVELHGGKIQLESTLGQGTCFYFDLTYPIYQDNKGVRTHKAKEEGLINESGFSGLKILLAEDNPMNVLFMVQLLSKWDIVPDVAKDGAEAIEMFEPGKYHGILMDIHMPNVNGLDAVLKIRQTEGQSTNPVYIMALTASVSDSLIASLKSMGFDDYLGKPFRPNDLHFLLDRIYHRVQVKTTV
jgi:signal transduction histidine kinase/ActR/RegA family two-component response regulator